MAVTLAATGQAYQGLSSDTKPAAAPGSTFYETDTGAEFIRDGSTWRQQVGVTLLRSHSSGVWGIV